MQRRFFAQLLLAARRHPRRRENDDGRNIRLKNFQRRIDAAFVGNDDAQRRRSLPAGDSFFAQLAFGKSEPDIVFFQRAMTDQDRIGQRALPQKMHFVFARSEIDRRNTRAS